jgi:hypothetical protein
MRGLFLSFQHLSPIVLLELLVLSTHFLWAQRTLPLEKIPIHLLDAPAPFARLSEVHVPLHLTDRRMPLTLEPNQGQTDSRMKFFPRYSGNYRLPPTTNAARYAAPRTFSFALTHGTIARETTCCVGNLEHYGHRIPWAGSIILRIVQQAKAHPHVTRVLSVLKPQL